MTLVRLPTALRTFAGNQKELELTGTTVAEVLDQLRQQYPALQAHLFDEAGNMRPYVNLFLNKTDIRNLQGVETQLQADDHLLLIPSIAGGSPSTIRFQPKVIWPYFFENRLQQSPWNTIGNAG